MIRRLGLIIALGIVFSAMAVPVSAQATTFGSWKITLTVCTNGFTVEATGGTTAGVNTSIKAVEAKLLLPNDHPPFIQLSKPLPFTSATGSILIASSSNPDVQSIGTGRFYFNEPVSVGAAVQTTFGVYNDGVPLTLPNDHVLVRAQNCTVPPPEVQVNDLSGVFIDPYVAKDPLWGDGRAWPAPTDEVAVYCLTKGPFAGYIVVNSLRTGGNPVRLGQFSINKIGSAAPKGISQPAINNQGELFMYIDEHRAYVFEWTHGPGTPKVVKAFLCTINKALYNKTENQLQYPVNAFGSDGRVAPYPTDKMVVYCPVDKRTIDVLGVDFQSQGYPLATFKYDEVVAAIPHPVIQKVPGQGSVSLQVDYDDNFFLKWIGGPWKDDQIKGFKCRF